MDKERKNSIKISWLVCTAVFVFLTELLTGVNQIATEIDNGTVSARDLVFSVILMSALSLTLSYVIVAVFSEKKDESLIPVILAFFFVSGIFELNSTLALIQALIFSVVMLMVVGKIKHYEIFAAVLIFIQTFLVPNSVMKYIPVILVITLTERNVKRKVLYSSVVTGVSALGVFLNKLIDMQAKLKLTYDRTYFPEFVNYFTKMFRDYVPMIVILVLTVLYFVYEFKYGAKQKLPVSETIGRTAAVFVPVIWCVAAELFSNTGSSVCAVPVFAFAIFALYYEKSAASAINRKICGVFSAHPALYVLTLMLIALAVTYKTRSVNALYNIVTNYFLM